MIFNKNNKGAEELKALLGFIYKSQKYENMISYIGLAERDIKRIIGLQVYTLAKSHYDSGNYNLDPSAQGENVEQYRLLDKLVSNIQLPVALHAYRRYVPSNDLTHSDKGRQIFVSADEKPAFEWMIDKDNENLLNLAYEATDLLLEFLDEHLDDAPIGEAWGQSEAFVERKKLFVNSVTDFETVCPIGGSRRILITLMPMLRECQENDIRPCLSDAKYDELSEQVVDMDLSNDNKILLGYIRPAMVLLAMKRALKRLSTEILPNRVLISQAGGKGSGSNQGSALDRWEIAKSLEADGMRELKKLQEFIRKQNLARQGESYNPASVTDRMDPNQKYFRP